MAQRRTLAIAAALVLAPLAALATPLWQETSAPRDAREGQPTHAGTGGSGTATQAVDRAQTLPDFTRLANAATSAVVSISTVQEAEPGDDPIKNLLDPHNAEPQKGLGSGFFIHADGYIVTNAHVVEDATKIVVTAKVNHHAREYPARIIGVDEATDIALLKIDADGVQFPVLPLGDSDGLQVAEWVAAVGNPYGLSSSITVGVVSYKGRTDVMPAGRDGYYDYIQTDASINPGNSGGPLLNTRGEVVAIANAVNAVGQGIGFAIPINMAKYVLGPLLKNGKVQRSWLGITVEDLTPESARDMGLPASLAGVLVSEVAKGSPAVDAGLKQGDVITNFNGSPIDDAQKLRWYAAVGGAGRQVPLTVYRKGHTEQFSARLGEMPTEEASADFPQPTAVGLVVRKVDVPTARSAGLALPLGAYVRDVRKGSAAERAGVAKGDVILKVDDLTIHTPGTLTRAISKVDSGEFAHVVLRRGAETVFVSIKKP